MTVMQPQLSPMNPPIERLIERLAAADAPLVGADQVFHVEGVGARFYFAYEQLRNAAEYRERHLLLHAAIQRFLQHFNRDPGDFRPTGGELVTELTHAGYLPNHSVPVATVAAIDNLGEAYSRYYVQLKQLPGTDPRRIKRWLVEILSIQYENLLVPSNRRLGPFMAFAYEHYLGAIDMGSAGATGNTDVDRMALYCAVQHTIFKSDSATIRAYALAPLLAEGPSAMAPADFVAANRLIDDQVQGPLANRFSRLVGRYGAPMRILRELLVTSPQAGATLGNREATLARIRSVTAQQYSLVQKTASDRLIKSIIFVLITKVLIGVALEVPYDLVRSGAIIWRPLLINIVFPPVYMMLIGLQVKEPGRQNTEVLVSYLDRIIYAGDQPVKYQLRKRVTSPTLNSVFWIVYALGFFVSFGLVIWLLRSLGFNLVNGLIFFIFFSAVSFLGFRLRRVANELRLLPERQNLLQVAMDYFSTPFVRVGHWLSDRYAKANFVTRVLDAAIELPLKTSLRVVQQWTGFIRDKQDEL